MERVPTLIRKVRVDGVLPAACRGFQLAKKSSFEFNVRYIDTYPPDIFGKHISSAVPTVLALHGIYGSHYDLANVVSELRKEQVRVIAPNLPGFRWTTGVEPLDELMFPFNAASLVDFLRRFSQAIDVPHYDMVLTHSSASCIALGLFQEENLNSQGVPIFKSAAMICPVPHERVKLTSRSINRSATVMLYDFMVPLGRFLSVLFLKLTQLRWKFHRYRVSELYKAFTFFEHLDPSEIAVMSANFRAHQIPVLLFTCVDDKLIDSKKVEKWAELVGVSKLSRFGLDAAENESEIVSSSKSFQSEGTGLHRRDLFKELSRLVVFAKGGHFPQTRAFPASCISHLCLNVLDEVFVPASRPKQLRSSESVYKLAESGSDKASIFTTATS